MYLSKDSLKKLYSKMASLYSGNDIESQGGTQFVSEIKYFLATDEFQKTKNHFYKVFKKCFGKITIPNEINQISVE